MQCRQQSAPLWKLHLNLKLSRVLNNLLSVLTWIYLAVLHAINVQPDSWKSHPPEPDYLSFPSPQCIILHDLTTAVDYHFRNNIFVAEKVLLFKMKWQMRETECESRAHSSKAGVGRDRMQRGNVTGRSICTLQAVLLANAAFNELYQRAALGLQAATHWKQVHHILKSMECL